MDQQLAAADEVRVPVGHDQVVGLHFGAGPYGLDLNRAATPCTAPLRIELAGMGPPAARHPKGVAARTLDYVLAGLDRDQFDGRPIVVRNTGL